MQSIRCPECGFINYRDDDTFPRCRQCRQELLNCAFCLQHESIGCTHSTGRRHYTSDGLAAQNCRFFSSPHQITQAGRNFSLPAPLWISILFVLICCLLTAINWFIDPRHLYFRGSPLHIETTAPLEIIPDSSFLVTMRVTNLLDCASTPYYLEIDADFLKTVDWESSTPPPLHVNYYHQRLFLEYEPLPSGGYRTVQLSFNPHPGKIAPFSARLYAPGNRLRHTITVPLQIAAQERLVPFGGALP